MTKYIKSLILSAAFLGISVCYAAEDPVKDRRAEMKTVAKSLGVVIKMSKGKIPFDAAGAETALKDMSKAAEKFGGLFVDGTDSNSNEISEASPKIWENKEDFAKQVEALKLASLKLAEASKGGKDALGAGIGDLTKLCSTCHKAYRIKKEK